MAEMNPYGCHNTERKPGYWAKSGTFVNERLEVVQNAVWITDRSTKQCQYRNENPSDPRCSGCNK